MAIKEEQDATAAAAAANGQQQQQQQQQKGNSVMSGGSHGGDAASLEDGDHHEGHDGTDFEIPQRFTKSGRKRAIPFPMKLMKVLSTHEFKHIITWMPSGRSFTILKPKAFVADILPDHFKSAKYSSFTRKLHRWGFMRHYRGEEAGAFYHRDFQKDNLDLAEQMTCHKAEPSKAATAVSVAAAKGKTLVGSKNAPSNLDKSSNHSLEEDMKQPGIAAPLPTPTQRLLSNVGQAPTPQRPQQQQQQQQHLHNHSAAAAAAAQPRRVPATLPSDIMLQLQRQQQQLCISEPPPNAAERLNAAIEIEVNRRLKERIHAVSQNAALASYALNNGAQSLHHHHHHASQMHRVQQAAHHDPSSLAWGNLQGQSLQNVLIQMELAKRQGTLDPTLLAMATGNFSRLASGNTAGDEDLPRTNIQGARTA